MTLEELLNHGIEFAQKQFAKSQSLIPMWLGETADSQMLPIIAPFKDDEEKDAAVETVRKTFTKHQVRHYVFLTEAWAVLTEKPKNVSPEKAVSDVYDESGGGSLEHHPQRQEVIYVIAEDRLQKIGAILPIVRPKNGVAHLAEVNHLPVVTNTEQVKGRFAGLLDDPITSSAQKH